MNGRHRQVFALAALFAAATLLTRPIHAQQSLADGQLRIGVTLGSTSFVGVSVEYFFAKRTSVDVYLGTWSLRDVSASAVVKRYAGGGDARAYAGLGLWTVLAWQEEGFGSALIARAPIGFEFEAFDRGSLGAEASLSRALAVARADPEDDSPPASRLVPLPGFTFKWATKDESD